MMLTLLSKELKTILNSLTGIVFMVIFLVVSGCLLWVIPGNYNIPENGYASMGSFFELAPVLLIFFIPALSMRVFSEEKRLKTLALLFTRPVRPEMIVLSKLLAVFLTVVICLLPTLIYVATVYWLGNPVGNLDPGAVAASYLGLLFVVLAFASLSVFASSLTSNQVVALIVGLLLCVVFYWGFDLVSALFASGKTQVMISELGMATHYQSIQRGLIDSRDLLYFLFVSYLFFWITQIVLHMFPRKSQMCIFILFPVLIYFFCLYLPFRLDWTQDKRYTLSPQTKDLLMQIDESMEINVYLDGEVNPGFFRLQRATCDWLSDLNRMSKGKLRFQLVNPYNKQVEDQLKKEGLQGIAVNERNREGKISQQLIYPWAIIKYKDQELPVPLLVNQQGRSGEQNLNTSIEVLEYQFDHALQLLTEKTVKKIVFLEGHDELSEAELNDVADLLSQSYQVDRGVLSGALGELDDYDLVIVAGPQQAFPEQDKYELDQYLMHGGRILWFVNGVQLQSPEELAARGETQSRINEVNLEDMLFTYGVRIEPVLLQDVQCLTIPVVMESENLAKSYVSKPWSFAPILLPNQDNPITKGLIPVSTEFASPVSFVGKENISRSILLTTSSRTHLLPVPERISLDETDREPNPDYFNQSYLPVAVLLEGSFSSCFKNRVLPKRYDNDSFLAESKPTRMIVTASEEIICGGYDPYTQTWYGNPEFVCNAVDYLTDDKGLALLKNRNIQLRLLDTVKCTESRTLITLMNIGTPSALPLLLFLFLFVFRRRKYQGK